MDREREREGERGTDKRDTERERGKHILKNMKNNSEILKTYFLKFSNPIFKNYFPDFKNDFQRITNNSKFRNIYLYKKAL